MTLTCPTFSVVIPLYNKASYVVEAIASVLAQTLQPHEVIVVDDGSTDGSFAKVEAISHPRLTLIRQPNAGVSAARNRGIQSATGDFVTFLDADDRYLPRFLDVISNLIKDFPSADVYCTSYQRFTADGLGIAGQRSNMQLPARGLVSDFYSWWTRSAFFWSGSIAVRRAELMKSGIRFPEGERLGEDQDTWFRLAERCAIAYDPAALSEYRVDVAGSATQSYQVLDILPCYHRLAQRLEAKLVPSSMAASAKRLVASHYLNVARARRKVGDYAGARQLILDPLARGNPSYFMRTLLFFVTPSWDPWRQQ